MHQRIFITGGSGLLGSYLIRWFKHSGYSNITATYQHSPDSIPPDIREGVRWLQLRLPDKVAAHEMIEAHDWVIHAAGLVSYKSSDKYRLLEINTSGTADIVNACLKNEVSHLIYIGSIGALGRETDHATLTESSPWVENEFSTGYGLAKYLGELEVWRGAAEGLNVSVILPSVILGTGDWNKSSLQLIERVVHKAGWYPGGKTGYVDVRDICAFVGLLLEKGLGGERWILNGANMSYEEVYKKIAFYLTPDKLFRLAPKWLAKLILTATNLLKKGSTGTEMLNQVYGSFTYEASKSLSTDGFRYRKIEITIEEIAGAYQKGKDHMVLPF